MSELKKIAITVSMTLLTVVIGYGLLWFDGALYTLPGIDNPNKTQITATSTAEFDLAGVDNKQEIKKEIELIIEERKAEQKKQEATEKLRELKKQKTSLE